MVDHSHDEPLRASDARFRRRREALRDDLVALLGSRVRVEPIADGDRAAALAAEAVDAQRAASRESWAVVRQAWTGDARDALVTLLHSLSERVSERAVWLIVPGREPQVVPLTSDVVLDNPLGFAAIGDDELVVLDQQVPAGLTLTHLRHAGGASAERWDLEVWGAEPWLSAATRALREG
jgi:hypothetical protein